MNVAPNESLEKLSTNTPFLKRSLPKASRIAVLIALFSSAFRLEKYSRFSILFLSTPSSRIVTRSYEERFTIHARSFRLSNLPSAGEIDGNGVMNTELSAMRLSGTGGATGLDDGVPLTTIKLLSASTATMSTLDKKNE